MLGLCGGRQSILNATSCVVPTYPQDSTVRNSGSGQGGAGLRAGGTDRPALPDYDLRSAVHAERGLGYTDGAFQQLADGHALPLDGRLGEFWLFSRFHKATKSKVNRPAETHLKRLPTLMALST